MNRIDLCIYGNKYHHRSLLHCTLNKYNNYFCLRAQQRVRDLPAGVQQHRRRAADLRDDEDAGRGDRGREVAAGAARGPPRHRPLGLHRGAHLGGLHAAPQPARHGQQILYW